VADDGGSGVEESATSSTVIGKSKMQKAAPGPTTSDPASSDIELGFADSGIGNDLEVVEDKPSLNSPKGASSDILAGAIDTDTTGSGEFTLGSDILGPDSVVLGAGESSIFGGGTSDVLGGSGPVLVNPGESAVSSEIAESETQVRKKGSDISVAAESGLSLEPNDDDDIFGGPKSDVTHRPSDSGILLIDPGDSGLSLDQPLDLGAGSSGKLETTEFQLGGGSSTGLQADDDFLLTPLEESAEDESDSGSQVIMLDTEGEADFGEATATLLSTQIPGMLEEESPLGAFGAAPTGGVSPAAQGAVMVPAVPETPFSGFMVLVLAVCMITVGLSGALMYDLVRNMWSWDGAYPVNSTLMDMIVGK
ncbi:MAG TPA: hypothetical protein VHV77_01675, partial [Pirellulales bacterium]|nr:hypothetical protein [Pirellulales bacterium]